MTNCVSRHCISLMHVLIRELWSQPCGLGESLSTQHLAVGQRQLPLTFWLLSVNTLLSYLWSHRNTQLLDCSLPLSFIDTLVSKKLGRCPVSQNVDTFCMGFMVFRKRGRYEEEGFILFNAFGFISRSLGYQGLLCRGSSILEDCRRAISYVGNARVWQQAVIPFLNQGRWETVAFTESLVQIIMKTWPLQWPAGAKLPFDSCFSSWGLYKPKW